MLNFCLSYRWIRWTAPTSSPPALPDGIERLFLQHPGGPIEILYAKPRGNQPTSASSRRAPFFFVHGGMGSAWVWLEYMEYLSGKGIPCYAISLRGHGESYHPSFWRMVYGTTKRMLADDLVAGIRWAQDRESGEKVVLVGHSSGGGLSQFILSEQDVHVKGLGLAGAVPGFGSMRVYFNWWLLDPFFTIRMLFHGWHPNSPLSHPYLTKRAFFSDHVSSDYVDKFQSHINAFESFLWPLGMMKPFVKPERLLPQISGWNRGSRILVLHGEVDRLMTWSVTRKLAETYRTAIRSVAGQKKIEAQPDTVRTLPGDGDHDDEGQGVRFCVVPGAGHHMQNDASWEPGARKLLAFYEQL